jgi:DegV family protein with EDD domain
MYSRQFFIPATLEFLRRGDRISDMTALIGTLLHIKPILTVRNGSLVVINRVRTMRHALAQLAESVIQHISRNSAIRFAFMHSNFPARAQELIDRTLAAFKDGEVKETIITDISPALGTHIGPEAVGLAYILEN